MADDQGKNGPSDDEVQAFLNRFPPAGPEAKAVSTNPSDTTAFTYLDYTGLGLILMAIDAVGQRWINDQPISGHTVVAACTAMVMGAVVLGVSKRCKATASQPKGQLRKDFEALANKAWFWFIVAAVIVFGVPLTVSYVSPSISPPSQTAPSGAFGFAPTAPAKYPSKNYSVAEKRQLLELIGRITILFNDKGFPAARTAHGIANNVPPSKGD